MSHKDATLSLFNIINGCLPYEYDIKLLNDHTKNPSILIVNENSDHIMQITPSKHGNTCTVLVWVDGDDPDTDSEAYQWNLESPDLTLDDILTDIKHHL